MTELNNGFLVRVSCMTFNQAAYIVDTMNGFCMQETAFPFVCTIIDDASNDGEQDVINNYLLEHFCLDDATSVRKHENENYRMTFAQHKTQKNCFFAVYFLKYNHYSIKKAKKPYIEEWCNTKYVAVCEGDDYWTNPNKLQMQVDFMESHEDFAVCFGDVEFYNSDKHYSKGKMGLLTRYDHLNAEKYEGKELFYRILMGKISVWTLSAMYRNDLIGLIKKDEKTFMMGDTQLWLNLSQLGKIKYFDTVFGRYNIHHGSATRNPSTRLRFSLSKYEMRCYYCGKYGYSIPKSLKKEYNKAYKDIMIELGIIKPEPLYGIFKLNAIQYEIDKYVIGNKNARNFYRKMKPFISFERMVVIKITIICKALFNLFYSIVK